MSIFGGVQVFQMIISIIRTKFVAILLGPTGIGIMGLINSVTELIAGFTNLGIGSSAIKDISAAYSTGNNERVSIIITSLSKWFIATGFLGLLMTFILSPILSKITFGSNEYTYAFMIISVVLLTNQLNSGYNSFLQGARQISHMAKANLLGSVLSLVITLPLYFYLKLKGIVPAIVFTSIITLIITSYYKNKLNVVKIKVTNLRSYAEGKNMLKMGIVISISGSINIFSSYIIRVFMRSFESIDDVGYYNAGFAIVNTYVGLIFASMSTDYYPRLAAISNNETEVKKAINEQLKIALLIISPILIIFIAFIKYAIVLFYSNKFLPIETMLLWATLGMFFKTASWAISYLFLAKGNSKIFLCSELVAISYQVLLNLIGYYFLGLKGLGISFLITYILYFLQVYLISFKKHGIVIDKEFYKIFITQFSLAISCFLLKITLKEEFSNILCIPFIATSVFLALRELNTKLDIRNLLYKKLK